MMRAHSPRTHITISRGTTTVAIVDGGDYEDDNNKNG